MTTPLSERMLEEAYVGGIAGWDDMIDEVASLEKRLEAAEKYAQHLPTCKWNRLGVFVGDAVYGECTCGFAALAGEE